MSITVYDFQTGTRAVYDTDDPVEAVSLGFLQLQQKNWNTWEYSDKLPALRRQIIETKSGYELDDICVVKEQ